MFTQNKVHTCRVCEQRTDNLSVHLCSEPRIPSVKNYVALKRLGKGSFGTVFLARKKETSDFFAVKVLTKGGNNEKKKWIYAERNSLVSINSTFVAKLYSAFQTRQHVFLVMEYVRGPTFDNILKKRQGGFPECEAKIYVAKLILATKHLHEQGVSHRDLKPENLMLEDDGSLKLVDFGYSAQIENENNNFCSGSSTDDYQPPTRERKNSLRYTAVGTPLYAPPETVLSASQGYDSKKVDMWSIGIILFEFLTGRVPFNAADYPSFKNVLRKYLVEPQVPWPENVFGITQEVKDIVQALLNPNPSERPSIEELKASAFFKDVAWDRLLNSQRHHTRRVREDDLEFDFMKELEGVIDERPQHAHNHASLAFYQDFDYFSIQNYKELNNNID